MPPDEFRRSQICRRPFGTLPGGPDIDVFSITNGAVELHAITYGGIITSLRVPDRNGQPGEVVLGHSTLNGYLDNHPYLGAIVGRYANRIAYGRFRLDGVGYQLSTNNGPHHLHGGRSGFDRCVWQAQPIDTSSDVVGVRFSRTSRAGEEGYPGTLGVSICYLLASDGVVSLRYEAATDAPTPVNLTQHTYFNLDREHSATVLEHELTIHAAHFTPVDAGLIPTGAVAAVAGTPFDFRTRTRIGSRLRVRHDQLQLAGGFDHNFVVSSGGAALAPVAELHDARSGRTLRVSSTEPGVQFYSGHLLDGKATGPQCGAFGAHAGLCLETQHFPDSPNQPHFPTAVLRPGHRYRSETRWEFGTE